MLEAVILVSPTAFGSEVVGPPAAERGRQTGEVRRAGGLMDAPPGWTHTRPQLTLLFRGACLHGEGL